MSTDELQTRVCRCCDREYAYPVKKSLATRFHCEECARLDEDVRALFERFNKRLRKLSGDLRRLEQRPAPRKEA
jgi:hypothetical protein